jgi:hypothetical protein
VIARAHATMAHVNRTARAAAGARQNLALSEVIREATKRPIVFGDTTIVLIRLTFASMGDEVYNEGVCHH